MMWNLSYSFPLPLDGPSSATYVNCGAETRLLQPWNMLEKKYWSILKV